ncbi:adenylate/guanylate cyclase domain-containing protein [Simiduia curdlanivorans]|uniref:Adenylate/guanylate cyclase domain-containing protein n=1 Tax=Simiduia curdlanivorans TaxID=1492769 RepID=A0ABV8UZJ7_9GAMM|nr:adenylate/guanylate cyclase domain-containing protein [Simiduia curdlanivorans]MDN3639234.1 adenylate/guanylate cyclase domain-containing protein [Simiduia curdlanivorans]
MPTKTSNPPQQDANSSQCAIMFADVCGSSSLYKALGNHAAEFKIRQLLVRVTSLIEQHQGLLIKTLGDEVMVRFDSAQHALDAAKAIQLSMAAQGGSLQLRIGISFGSVLLKQGDAFGDTVNDAAFVAQIARAEEIILTQPFVSALPTSKAKLCKEFDRVALKGDGEKSVIYRLQWQAEKSVGQATQVMSLIQTTQQFHKHSLRLASDQGDAIIAPEETPFHLGRATSNQLQLESNFASRDHCHILYRRGKFVLIDHSTNGTYVTPAGQREIYLRREELPLEGRGDISLGCPAQQSPLILSYHFSN